MDLDQYLESELASINDMFQEFQTQDQQHEKRIRSEREELKAIEAKAKEVSCMCTHGTWKDYLVVLLRQN